MITLLWEARRRCPERRLPALGTAEEAWGEGRRPHRVLGRLTLLFFAGGPGCRFLFKMLGVGQPGHSPRSPSNDRPGSGSFTSGCGDRCCPRHGSPVLRPAQSSAPRTWVLSSVPRNSPGVTGTSQPVDHSLQTCPHS